MKYPGYLDIIEELIFFIKNGTVTKCWKLNMDCSKYENVSDLSKEHLVEIIKIFLNSIYFKNTNSEDTCFENCEEIEELMKILNIGLCTESEASLKLFNTEERKLLKKKLYSLRLLILFIETFNSLRIKDEFEDRKNISECYKYITEKIKREKKEIGTISFSNQSCLNTEVQSKERTIRVFILRETEKKSVINFESKESILALIRLLYFRALNIWSLYEKEIEFTFIKYISKYQSKTPKKTYSDDKEQEQWEGKIGYRNKNGSIDCNSLENKLNVVSTKNAFNILGKDLKVEKPQIWRKEMMTRRISPTMGMDRFVEILMKNRNNMQKKNENDEYEKILTVGGKNEDSEIEDISDE